MDWAALRKVMSSQDDEYRAYYTDEELAETPAQRKARMQNRFMAEAVEKVAAANPGLPKGTCPKCREYIGRGVHFHAKACNG